jgi:hypothetical protein
MEGTVFDNFVSNSLIFIQLNTKKKNEEIKTGLNRTVVSCWQRWL